MNVLSEKPDPTPPCHVITTINDLPNVIMEDILIRLPTKSCFQCTCVSKRWHALISTANFAHRFLRYPIIDHAHTIDDDLLLLEGKTPLFQLNPACLEDFKALPFSLRFQLHYRKHIKILASCGDFLLCSETEQQNHKNGSCFSYYIGNPISQRWAKLPPLRGVWKNHLVGFVFDEKRLVVVHLTIRHLALATLWKLSSSDADDVSWSSFPMSYYSHQDILKNVEFNGYLLSHNNHFRALNGRLYLVAEKGVLEYNPISGFWSFFGFGFKVVSHHDTFRIGSCGGVISVSQLNASTKYCYFRVWELMEDCRKGNKKVWYLKRDVKFNRICSSNGECSWRTVLNFHLSDGEKVYLNWNSFSALCNLKEKTVQLLGKNKVDFYIGLFSTWAPKMYNYRPRARKIWH